MSRPSANCTFRSDDGVKGRAPGRDAQVGTTATSPHASAIGDLMAEAGFTRHQSRPARMLQAAEEVVFCHDLYVLSLVLQSKHFGGFACGGHPWSKDIWINVADD
jgi:hypothetical protein